MIRHFDVSAIQVPIVYNKYGDNDPNGLMYVLNDNIETIRQAIKANPLGMVELVQPLVIRAHQGDTVEIAFTNRLNFPASINIKGLPYKIQQSDGAFVGDNENTVAQPNETLIYTWEATIQGTFHFSDLGNAKSTEEGSNIHGLFGAIVVEMPGSKWTHPQTGEYLKSGVFADIHHPFVPDWREYVTIFHDEAPVKDKNGNVPIDPMTNAPEMTHSINYRAEPMRNKMHLIMHESLCPECEGEEVHHDSWVFGDPPDNVLPRAYVGDPVRWHVVHGGVQETHIFHLHLHQWLSEKMDQESFLNDSRALSPGQSFTFDILYGAGSLQKAYGDVIYHCHLYPHFTEGMWGIFRIHDVFENGTRFYPDGTPITKLQPLPDRPCPRKPTPKRPGFPLFIPGTVGRRAPVPPIGWDRTHPNGDDFPITEKECNALAPNWQPGALFVNPCPRCTKIRRYDIVAIQMELTYNEAGWHDPEGRFYVLKEDEADIRAGRKKPEPLYIRARAGECIEIHFTNKLPEQLGPNGFQLLTNTIFASTHVHFVKFDVLSSDGANTGWNYLTGARHEQEVIFRWFADVDLKTCFFHDHLFANSHQFHGLFGGLIIEPEGSTFRDSFTGKPMRAGTQAIIENPFIPDFREFCLAVHDFVPLYNTKNEPLNPPEVLGMIGDMGVMAFNYTNAPFQVRGGEPAYVLSSYLHGDPWTPVFQGYAGDPVRVRLLDGAHEESHSINFNRFIWHRDRMDVDSPLTQQQHIGISEAFTFEFELPSNDYNQDFDTLYYSGAIDDLWLGTWGITRVRGTSVPFLKKLHDRPKLPARTQPLPRRTGMPPQKAVHPGNPYPEGAKVNYIHVAAVQVPIEYNKFGDRDPFGMVFVPFDQAEDVLEGKMNPKPFIFTINGGEGIELTLTNLMKEEVEVPQFPEVPVQAEWPYSPRVSMHSQYAIYDVLGSDGATVGFNPDQTIGVGESITYRWYYEEMVNEALVVDLADVMNHRKYGLFGAIGVVEAGSKHYDSFSGELKDLGEQLTITNPFIPNYRQFIVMPHNGIYLENKGGEILPPGAEEEFDDEDQGMKGYNLRSEPFLNRLEAGVEISEVFASQGVGDPSTPILYAKVNDPVTVKVLMPADKPRATTFDLHGHASYAESEDKYSEIIGVQGAITIGGDYKRELLEGASGGTGEPGDYMYRSANITWDIEQGMWGIMRVLRQDNEKIIPLNVV